jgi:hypothetical protein
MVEIQKLICPECKVEFDFDPNSNTRIVTSLNESVRPKLKKEIQVTAYLKCPNGHTKPYTVTKQY